MTDRLDVKVLPKVWGREIVFANFVGHGYCGKILDYDCHARSSRHYHPEKHETFFVLEGSGKAYLWRDPARALDEPDRSVYLNVGDRLVIPPRMVHDVVAFGGGLKIVEVSTPHADDDVVRVPPFLGHAGVPR